jgi:hypothetical protein
MGAFPGTVCSALWPVVGAVVDESVVGVGPVDHGVVEDVGVGVLAGVVLFEAPTVSFMAYVPSLKAHRPSRAGGGEGGSCDRGTRFDDVRSDKGV